MDGFFMFARLKEHHFGSCCRKKTLLPRSGTTALEMDYAYTGDYYYSDDYSADASPATVASTNATNPVVSTIDEEEETLIFLDIDGVLNVGINDAENGALLLNDKNLAVITRLAKSPSLATSEMRNNIARVKAVLRAIPSHGDKTYADFMCEQGFEFSVELTKRFARIVLAAGSNAEVVLSSTWRWPQYEKRVAMLETAVSKFMGRKFRFASSTHLCKERAGVDRLRTIADDMAMLGKQRDVSRPLNVIVLDDFFFTSFDNGEMDIGDTKIRSRWDAAKYICQRYAPSENANIRCTVVHTFTQFHTPDGIEVKLGTGLTMEHVRQAKRALQRQHSIRSLSTAADSDDSLGYEFSTRRKVNKKLDDGVSPGVQKGNGGKSSSYALAELRQVMSETTRAAAGFVVHWLHLGLTFFKSVRPKCLSA